jgi:hypothetical protein
VLRATTVYGYGHDNKRLTEITNAQTRAKKVYFYDLDGRLMTQMTVTGFSWTLPQNGYNFRVLGQPEVERRKRSSLRQTAGSWGRLPT